MKKVLYQNAIGQKIFFDNKTLFCESIDMLGNSAVHASETLALSDGQVTLSHQLAPKTIPCSFAFKNRNPYDKQILESIFNPLISGTLTVYTDSNVYQIDCYPQNVPTFKRDAVPYVYRFDVDFVADFPYWRVGQKKTLNFNIGTFFYTSLCPFNLPLEIRFPKSTERTLFVTSAGFQLKPRTEIITVNTQNFTVRDNRGRNCMDLVVTSGSGYIFNKVFFHYGENCIHIENCLASMDDIQVSFYDLSFGEM